MRFTSKDVIRAFMEKTGIKINQKFNTSRTDFNPCYINQDYEIRDSRGCKRSNHLLINAEITEPSRFKNREAMREKLKELANGFKPNWSDEDQSKTSIGYSHLSEMCVAHNTYSYQYSLDTVYFESREDAQKAIDHFTDEEWKMYFGIED